MSTYWEPDIDRIVFIGGRPLRDVKVELPPDQIRRLAQGYMCLRCLEPLKEAFPEKCPNDWCGYRIREEQPADFERCLEKLEPYVPSDDWEPAERARKAGIWVPKAVK